MSNELPNDPIQETDPRDDVTGGCRIVDAREDAPSNEGRRVMEGSLSRTVSLLIARAHRLRFFLVVGLLVTCGAVNGTAARAGQPDFALRTDGYLGYSNIDLAGSRDGFTGGGSGSASLLMDTFYAQIDLAGDVTDFEDGLDVSTVSPGLHAGWRDPERGSIGLVGSYTRLDLGSGSIDVHRGGFESELFLDRVTLGLNAGHIGVESSSNVYAELITTAYPIEQVRISARGGVYGIEDGVSGTLFGVSSELLLTDHLAPFVRWESTVSEGLGEVLQHGLVAGLTLYWGTEARSLRETDRRYFKPSCGGFLIIGRFC